MNLTLRVVNGFALAGLVALGGCSNDSGLVETPAPVAHPVEQKAAPAWNAVAEESQTVNVFGEIGGAKSRVGHPGEGALQQHTNCEEGYDADVTVDPSGKWLAFASTRHSEHPDIYLQRVEGTSVVQLTSDPADDAQPCFSPDGRQIAFASTRGGNWDIYVMDVDGKNVQQVTHSPAHEMHPSFSPDGTRLAYCALSGKSQEWELWVIDLTTHEKRMIGPGLFPSWSPRKDVDRIAFQRARQRGSHWFSVWTVDLVEGEPRRLTEVAVSSSAAVVAPTWSPDGSHLSFATIQGPDKTARSMDIWLVSSDGSDKRRLTDASGLNLSPFWASNNRIYFVSDRGGHENVWSLKAEGSASASAAAPAHGAPAPAAHEAAAGPAHNPAPAKEPSKAPAVGSVDTHE